MRIILECMVNVDKKKNTIFDMNGHWYLHVLHLQYSAPQ